MGENPETDKWGKIAGAAFLSGIIVGVLVGYFTEWMNAVFTFLIFSGVFLAVSFSLRRDIEAVGGLNPADGAVMGGVLLAGIGACGFIYYYTHDVTITAVSIIVVMIIASAVMMIRNRRYL
jgi:hypothetical protein